MTDKVTVTVYLTPKLATTLSMHQGRIPPSRLPEMAGSGRTVAGLDRATCDNVARRARFEPATDASGANVAGSYANNIRWVIPK